MAFLLHFNHHYAMISIIGFRPLPFRASHHPKEVFSMQTYDTRYKEMPVVLTAVPMGKDYAITVSGGDRPRIGAVAVCQPGEHASLITTPSHRGDTLAMDMAAIICNELSCTVTVATGIHFEGLTKKEMDGAIEVAGTLMDRFLKDVRKHPPIL
jgi:hypothetical protein